MLFNSAQYGFFLVAVLIVHWSLPQRWRRPFLLVASYFFYASAIPQYIALILGLTAFDYVMGLAIARAQGAWRRRLLWLAVAGNLGSLAYFKYTGLIMKTLAPILAGMPLLSPLTHDTLLTNVLLPLGISFFTFEFIHYVVEVFKGTAPIRNVIDFALFAAFFPTQIAGPIKRFPDWMKQLRHPASLREIDVDRGVWLILRGLVKKVIMADVLAPVVATGFNHVNYLGPGAAWFAVFAFATQIYCDFSGYTDMGRGSATLLGYSVPENFNRPYQSANPAEFWHRWHMSLSTWLRDYLYIPLGGSRVSRRRIYINLMITMALGGLWHGADWHFMVWGIYQGVLLAAHRYWGETFGKSERWLQVVASPIARFLTRVCTLVLVCAGWVFFRADTIAAALSMFVAMFAFGRPFTAGLHLTPFATPVLLLAVAALVVVSGWIWTEIREPVLDRLNRALATLGQVWVAALHLAVLRPSLYAATVLLLLIWPPHTAQTFIYFRF